MYAWPVDCVHLRWVACSGVLQIDKTTQLPVGQRFGAVKPTPFLVTDVGLPNPPNSSWGEIEGANPESSRVILSDELVPDAIYTGLNQYPDSWDPLFEQAFIAVLAARFAMPLIEDKKVAVGIRGDNLKIAKMAIDEARIRDGNEGWTVTDVTPDWIAARWSGGGGCSAGTLYNGFLQMPMVDTAGGAY